MTKHAFSKHRRAIGESEGIILRHYPSREADLVLRVLTGKFGKITLFANNARKSKKRFASGLDLFECGRFTIIFRSAEDRLSGTLSEFTPVKNGLHGLRSSLGRLACASSLCEAFDFMVHEGSHAEEHDRGYNILKTGLFSLSSAASDRQAFKICYLTLRELLIFSGYLDRNEPVAPSARNLNDLLNRIEHAAEKDLKSKHSLMETVSSLSQNPTKAVG